MIAVFVGTDHHPFPRLVEWADTVQEAHPEDVVTVQYGYSAPPSVARGSEFLAVDDLRETVRRSDVVVTHGGPGTIMDVRAGGHRPIIMGRDPRLGEHVDDHQLRFVEWAAAKGLGHLVHDAADLDACVRALGPEGTRHATEDDGTTALTARRVAALVAQPRPSTRTSLLRRSARQR